MVGGTTVKQADKTVSILISKVTIGFGLYPKEQYQEREKIRIVKDGSAHSTDG